MLARATALGLFLQSIWLGIGGSASLDGHGQVVGQHQMHHHSSGLQCQRIAVSACQGLGYNMTALPNLAGHTNQLEAELQIAKLMPLIESGCSRRARFLLCSALFPLCTPDVPRPVTACKSLCETVKGECAANAGSELMQLWPSFLSCENLPQPEKHELCMQIPQEGAHAAPTSSPAASEVAPAQDPPQQQQQQQLPQQLQHPQQQQHMSRFWMSWKTGGPLAGGNGGAGGGGGAGGSLSAIVCPQNFSVSHLNPEECLPQCQRDAYHTTQQKKLTESLILGLSAVCFVLTLFALVTFWAEPTRFGYPERPVLFLCLCYNLFSVCYLERIVFHNQARSLAQLQESQGLRLRPVCQLTPPCLASYITTSYLSLCAASWWLIFALCFYLSSHKKWSSEALEKRSGLFHVLAWVPPLVPPIAALLLERVRPSELTGMCSAPGFVELPALVLLLLGLYFTLRASRSLHSLQQQLQPTLAHHRFGQIRKRFVIFSLLFFVPTAAGVVAALCERFGDPVPSCSTPEDCASPEPLTAWPALVRIFFQLAGGTLTGMWVWSRKTCESYRSRLVAGGTPTSSLMAQSKSGAGVNGNGHANAMAGGGYALPKKHLYTSGKSMLASGGLGGFVGGGAGGATAPLYAGISFHNVPVYNPNQSIV
ncbi:frizzled-3 [Drosophila guanche]|uniref:Blast:Frizzled-3 n=1 Tax=Drosophila guanche TaxID=7266 RepID=A0A3B0J8D1_DROGU|nr:frizzled-3 [Drosophila guanche]SPP78437.1 blast:Frizzled-3 [Drosophila guanche]